MVIRKFLAISLLLLIPRLCFAQDCTKGQTVTFAQLPTTSIAGTACTQTDATSCIVGNAPGSGGALTCIVIWSGSSWIAGTQTPWSGSGVNLATPGAIGGTTSSTGQFTKLSVGTSVPTLPTVNALSFTTGVTPSNVPEIGQSVNGNDIFIQSPSIGNGTEFWFNGTREFNISNLGFGGIGGGSHTATISWENGSVSEQNAPRFAITAEDAPGVLADTAENFGSFKAQQAIKVIASNIYVEKAAGSCTTAPTYNLCTGTTYGTCTTTIVSACGITAANEVTLNQNIACTTTGTNVAQNSFVWWTIQTAAGTCTPKNHLEWNYQMQ